MAAGLEDVVAAETCLSHVDGQAGRLLIAGHAGRCQVQLFSLVDA